LEPWGGKRRRHEICPSGPHSDGLRKSFGGGNGGTVHDSKVRIGKEKKRNARHSSVARGESSVSKKREQSRIQPEKGLNCGVQGGFKAYEGRTWKLLWVNKKGTNPPKWRERKKR